MSEHHLDIMSPAEKLERGSRRVEEELRAAGRRLKAEVRLLQQACCFYEDGDKCAMPSDVAQAVDRAFTAAERHRLSTGTSTDSVK
jgi:hypothetical protein